MFLALGVSNALAATHVIYFGGYGATPAHMHCWQQGAQAQTIPARYTFETHEYPPNATSSKASAIQKGARTIASVVAKIDSNPSVHFIVAGHSSGAALSNRVAELVRNPAQIELVSIDGFSPTPALQRRVSARCIYGVSSTVRGLRSMNASGMQSNCAASYALPDSHCQTSWCMHFTLVNKSVPSNLDSATFKQHGYDGCASNLSWLDPSLMTFATNPRLHPGN